MKTLAQLLAATSLLGLACAPEGTEGDNADCEGAKCDDADQAGDTPCDGTMIDQAGRGLSDGKIVGLLGDSLAKLAFGTGETCPTTFPDVVAKLLESGKCNGHRSMLVSETAQLRNKADSYRSVTFMECEVATNKTGSVWFSTFGIQANTSDLEKTEIPTNAEMFAFDPVAGVFNYYETKGEEIEFFGNSEEFITEGASGQTRRCAACHTGGGPIMKELNAPWLHWEGDFNTPGHSEIISGNKTLMGDESDGIDLEGIVAQGNDEWNERRIAFIKENLKTESTIADLLRPVFCTVEVNIDSDIGKTVTSVSLGEAVVDSSISNFGSVSMTNTEYQAIIKSFGSKMAFDSKKVDTLGAFTRIQRGEADTNYVDKLVEKKIITQEFVQDALLVDFTRAVFSTDRCGLLEFAPDLAAKDATSKKIKDGFVKNLEAADDLSKPAADFLRNLKEDKDDPNATTTKFEEACSNRTDKVKVGTKEVKAAAVDVLSYIINVREQAVKLPVFEFDGFTMPNTNVGRTASTRLHPETCALTTSYVSVQPVIEGQEPEEGEQANNSCEGRCNEFTDGAACQCDAMCEQFNNCCEDKAEVCGEG